MLAHRLRRWPNIETAVGECPVFAEVIQTPGYILPSQVPARPRTAFNTLVGRFFFFLEIFSFKTFIHVEFFIFLHIWVKPKIGVIL